MLSYQKIDVLYKHIDSHGCCAIIYVDINANDTIKVHSYYGLQKWLIHASSYIWVVEMQIHSYK